MSIKYKFHEKGGAYFVSFATVNYDSWYELGARTSTRILLSHNKFIIF